MEKAIEFVMGQDGEASLNVRSARELTNVRRVEGNRLEGQLRDWKRVAVMTTTAGGRCRLFVLAPSETESVLTHRNFSVKGRFTIENKINTAKHAREVWKMVEVA